MGYLSCRSHLSVATADHDNPAAAAFSGSVSSRNLAVKEFEYSDLEAATGGFSKQKLLGRGSHGAVYKATLHNGRRVAVKRSSSSRAPTPARVEVENEIDILSQIRSPRLVNLVGFTPAAAAGDNQDRLLVMEFMKNGTLYDVLHSAPNPPPWPRRLRLALQTAKAVLTLHSSDPPVVHRDIKSANVLIDRHYNTLYDVLHSAPNPPPWPRRLRLALQTAKAVLTLHSSDPPVVHRDIKSANVLIDRHYNARLGDFGLALRCGGGAAPATPPAGTLGYLDPCYLTPASLSTKTDVFSFGILLLEIISGRKAIDVSHSPPYVLDWAVPLIKRGKIGAVYDPRVAPPKDTAARRQIPLLAAKCLRSARDLRPSMEEVVDCLARLSKAGSSLPIHHLLHINNPCIAAADVGRPPARAGERPGRARSSSARNLMDLLKDDGGGETGVRRSSSCRSTTASSSRGFGFH